MILERLAFRLSNHALCGCRKEELRLIDLFDGFNKDFSANDNIRRHRLRPCKSLHRRFRRHSVLKPIADMLFLLVI